MLSQTAEYALRAIAFLAGEPEVSKTAEQAAEATKVPARYMSKVLQSLGRAGLVRAQRGLHGGFSLARSPSQITMLDVVDAIDPLQRIEHCPLGLPSHVKLCPLHRRLDDAVKMIQKALGDTTIAEILAEKDGAIPLCDPAMKRGEAKVKLSVRKSR